MPNESKPELFAEFSDPNGIAGFRSGALVIAGLSNPREKFWGVLLSLATPGIVLRGISLESFDDFVSQVRSGEAPQAGTMFFPMQRVERIELDEAFGEIHSLAQKFESKTGQSAAHALMRSTEVNTPTWERP